MESNKIYDAKIITLGDSLVGKTCLILLFLEDTYFSTYISTIYFDLKQKIVKLENGDNIKLITHDTAGQNKKSFIFSQIDFYLINLDKEFKKIFQRIIVMKL